MDLKTAIDTVKKSRKIKDAELAGLLGISRPQLAKLKNGYTSGLPLEFLKRASNFFKISIDELVNHQILPNGYHCPEGTFYTYIAANDNYPQYYIKKGDILYVFPFYPEESKIDDLILVERSEKMILEPYTGIPGQGNILFHVIGIVRKNTKVFKKDQDKIVFVSMSRKKQKKSYEAKIEVGKEDIAALD